MLADVTRKTVVRGSIVLAWISLVSLVLPGSAEAGVVSGKIERLLVDKDGGFVRIFIASTPSISGSECNGTFDSLIAELPNTAAGSRFLATVQAAFLAGKAVEFWWGGCTSGTYWGKQWPNPYNVAVWTP